VIQRDIRHDGRMLHAYDAGTGDLPVVWFHGTPNIGEPPRPLADAAEALGVRWIGYDRPGYGGSTPVPDRDIASAAADVAAVADALEIDRFAVVSHSGGGPRALACAALLPDRVLAVATLASLAPYDADDLDWFAGMDEDGASGLRAAAEGRDAKWAFLETSDAPPAFTAADEDMFDGPWSWLIDVVRPALAAGPGPMVDDDLAYVRPWGFEPHQVTAPTLLVHGEDDLVVPSAHSAWLAGKVPRAELWLRPADGHISVLAHAEDALGWVAAEARERLA
jgi:pimeloyl-ACP methyl ester carboxylesterase